MTTATALADRSIAPLAAGSLRDIIDSHAETQPDSAFLIDAETGAAIDFRTLQMRARGVADLVRRAGIQPGETVAYATSNCPDAAVVILGLIYGGYLATAINLVAGSHTISYVLDHSECRLILANDAGRHALAEALESHGDIKVLDIADVLANQPETPPIPEAMESGGLLMYTSGTTGQPKGVVLSQQNLVAGGANTALAHQLSGQDRGLCVLPLYHINGLCVTLLGALVSGGSLVVPPRFSVSKFWPIMIEQACSWFSVVPTQISYLLHDSANHPDRDRLGKVRFGRSASAPLSPDIQSAFEDAFGITIIETMGLTETAAQILSNPLPPGTRKIGSPGIAFGNELCIADSSQNALPPETEGEVLVRGPNVMQYYLKNEEATAQAITRDGWLRTGDLGRMDRDGYVYITGRLKELIIKGGENIAPREIDEALYAHAQVVEAAAFGCPCQRYGERVEAAVMVSDNATVSEQDLIDLCRGRVGAFKSPDRIHFMPELPKGPSGKIQRKRLLEIFANPGRR